MKCEGEGGIYCYFAKWYLNHVYVVYISFVYYVRVSMPIIVFYSRFISSDFCLRTFAHPSLIKSQKKMLTTFSTSFCAFQKNDFCIFILLSISSLFSTFFMQEFKHYAFFILQLFP